MDEILQIKDFDQMLLRRLMVLLLTIHFNAYCQTENLVKMDLKKFAIDDSLKSKLKSIVEKIRPVDSRLTFTISVNSDGGEYLISLSTSYEIGRTEIGSYSGFFHVNDKLFLIYKATPELFFSQVGNEVVEINVKESYDSKNTFEPYIDELPYWIMRFRNGRFESVYSSY